jgi:putative transport protein
LAVILFVKLSPVLFKVSLSKEEQQYDQTVREVYPQLTNRNFVVENPNIFGRTLGELKIRTMTHCNISRVMHEGEAFTPTAKTVLHRGDLVKAVGTDSDLNKIQLLVGSPTQEQIPLSHRFVVQSILVTNEKMVNKSLGEIGLFEQYDATATSIRRAGIDFSPDANSTFHFGDKVMIAVNEQNLANVQKLLGDNRKRLIELDILPVAAGITLGILLGMVELPFPGFRFSLGITGGVLLAAIILSRIGKTGNILWNVSGPSNQMLRKIGLVFFMVSVGTSAGGNLVETLSQGGLRYFMAGALITLLPMALAMLVGRYLFKINFLVLLGALTGAMTSTPALSAVEPMTDSNAPKISYATVYPFALVLIIVCSQLISIFV